MLKVKAATATRALVEKGSDLDLARHVWEKGLYVEVESLDRLAKLQGAQYARLVRTTPGGVRVYALESVGAWAPEQYGYIAVRGGE